MNSFDYFSPSLLSVDASFSPILLLEFIYMRSDSLVNIDRLVPHSFKNVHMVHKLLIVANANLCTVSTAASQNQKLNE